VIRSPGTPHIWAHGASPVAFERARPILDELLVRHRRYRLLLTSRDAMTRRWLRQAFPQDTVLPPPPGGDWRVRRAIGRLRPHALLLLDRVDDLGRAVFERARWWRFPVILVGGTAQDLGRTEPPLLGAVDHFLVRNEEAATALRARGVVAARIDVVRSPADSGSVGPETPDPVTDRCVALLLPLLHFDWAALGTSRPQGSARWLNRLLDSRPGRLALQIRAHRIDSLDALRATLGPCDTILCLGNGPSSEDAGVSTISFDWLFRVNCSWVSRGRLTQPHVVFIGDGRCLRLLEGCVFGFRTVEEEARFLTDRLRHGRLRRLRYLTVERLPVSINECRWPARPTNGAAMVAMAAALEPKRLVIAGVDLFEHPSGAYPGDAATPNDYLLMHDRRTELAILDRALRRFRGELTVLSDPLARGLGLRPGAGPEAVDTQ
jgi:hypothetical protein